MKLHFIKRIKPILTIFLFILLNTLHAQDIVFKASAPDTVSMGDEFMIIYTTNIPTDSINVNFGENFKTNQKPSISSTKQTIVRNGRVVATLEKSFTYYLEPLATGKFIIPKASFIYKGEVVTSNSVTIYVKEASKTDLPEAKPEIAKEDLYIDVTFSKKKVFVQEGIIATFKVHTKNIVFNIIDFKLPAFDGFIYYDITNKNNNIKAEKINNKIYSSLIIKEILLYPKKNGSLKVNGAALKCKLVMPPKYDKKKSIFDESSTPAISKSIIYTLNSDEQTIIVDPLPDNPASNFLNICGTNISITANVNNTKINVNNPFSYEITITGNGNLKQATIPKLKLPDQFTEVSKNTDINLTQREDSTKETRTFIYTINPLKAGNFIIPQQIFTYFDVELKKYNTVAVPAVGVKVKK